MAEAIGIISESAGTVTAVSSDGYERTVGAGDQIFEGEVISAGSASNVSITFNNGCKMSLGEGETALIDETVYKLEFFDDAEVVVDLESAEGISKEVAEAQEEEVDEVYLASDDTTQGDIIEEIDLEEMEDTAAGGTVQTSQVDEAEIEERIEVEETTTQTGDMPQTQGFTSQDTQPRGDFEDRGAEILTPEAPTLSLLTLSEDGFTNSVPTISGTAPEGSVVEVYDNNEPIGSITVDASETFEFQPDALEDGTHSLTAQVIAPGGTTSDMSDPIVFTLDTTAPVEPSIESSDLTNMATPTISGSSEALSSVEVTVEGKTYTTVADDHGIWSVTLDETVDGTYDISVTVADRAGNVSETTSSSITIDSTAPDAPVIDALGVTNDATPTVTGSAEAGSTVRLYSGESELGETTAASDGSWSLTLGGMEDGQYTLTAVVTDSAGNTSGSSVVQSLIIDTLAPGEPTVNSVDVDTTGLISIEGTAESGSAVAIELGGERYTVTADDAGSWSVTTGALEEGSYLFYVNATDSAGNISQSAAASIVIDTSSVEFTVDYENAASSGTTYGIADTTLYGFTADAGFDPDATTLNLDSAQTDVVSEHNKGYGIIGDGGKGDTKAISGDEAFVISLDTPTDNIEVSINKMNFFESGRWIAFDENMEQVGQASFGFIDSLLGSDESYDSSFLGNSGVLTINSDVVDGDFQYLVLTTDDGLLGRFTSFFVEDVSYEVADTYAYEMTLSSVPMDDAMTELQIDGLDESVRLQDSDGNDIGIYEEGVWTLGEEEISSLATLNGELTLQVISDDPLPEGSISPTFTVIETSLDAVDTQAMDTASPFTMSEGVLDFENLDDVQRIDLSEDQINMENLSIEDVMQIAPGESRLEIVSGEHDEHVLTLNAADWEIKTDSDGNAISFESEGNAYTVYTSTDGENAYDLIIDQMITIELES